jgi:hypothetical protein
MRSEVIVVRGAPGTGKSSVARCLGGQLGGGVTIEVDDVRSMIHGISWESHELHVDAIHAAAATAQTYLCQGRLPIVFVDTLGFGRLEIALAALGATSVAIYSLFCRDPQLTVRLWRRFGGYRNCADARKFNAHIMGDEAHRAGLIDTTWVRPATVARGIVEREGWVT